LFLLSGSDGFAAADSLDPALSSAVLSYWQQSASGLTAGAKKAVRRSPLPFAAAGFRTESDENRRRKTI